MTMKARTTVVGAREKSPPCDPGSELLLLLLLLLPLLLLLLLGAMARVVRG